MSYQAKTIRTFIGAKNYDESRTFYQELGFDRIWGSCTFSKDVAFQSEWKLRFLPARLLRQKMV